MLQFTKNILDEHCIVCSTKKKFITGRNFIFVFWAAMSAPLWRLSSTCVLLRQRAKSAAASNYDYQVLLQKRGNVSRKGTFVFPGGVYEEEDQDLKTTALRELFEETGVLLCSGHRLNSASVWEWRKKVHEKAGAFPDMLSTLRVSMRYSALKHFCTFVTPEMEKRKYTTLFFLAESSEADLRFLEADGLETSSLAWVDPGEAIEYNNSGKMPFLPPQFYVFKVLSQYHSIGEIRENIFDQGGEGSDFSSSNAGSLIDMRGFPAMQPHPLFKESTKEKIVMALPFDSAHHKFPGRAGQKHRINCRMPMGKGGYELSTASLDTLNYPVGSRM
mgnify:CR=1 FL=1